MTRELLVRGKEHIWSFPLALWGILLLSLVLGLVGLKWGAPHLWHPDEHIRIILAMGQNLDPNPHYFGSPVLPMYLGAMLLVPYYGYLLVFRPEFISSLGSLSYAAESLSQVPDNFLTNIILAIRLVSVAFSLLSIVVIYIIAKRAFSKRTALLSCFLLALSPLFIPHAKFATINIFLLFFLWMSLLFQQRYLGMGSERNLLAAAVFVGLAMACKYTGVYGALYLPVVVLLKAKPRSPFQAVSRLFRGDMLKAAILATVIFLVANPWPILAPKEVFDDLVYENTFKAWSSGVSSWQSVWNPTAPRIRGWVRLPVLAFQGLTPPLFLLALFGMAAVVTQGWPKRSFLEGNRLLQLHLLLWLLFYYGAGVGPWVSSRSRYLVPIVPVLIIFAAAVLECIWNLGGQGKAIWKAGAVFILLFVTLAGGMVVYEFTNESRHRAGEWLQEHLASGDTIGYFSQQRVYLPPFPKGVKPIFFPFIHNVSMTDEEFQEHTVALSDAGPDYLVLTSEYYNRFYVVGGPSTRRTEFYDEMLGGMHPLYEPVAEFSQHDILGYSPPIEFVSPTITILRQRD